jgi:molecular chaperone DnaK (HSP70)
MNIHSQKGLPAMETDSLSLMDGATARAYFRNMVEKIEDPEKMLDFLNACEILQAALVSWLYAEHYYDCFLRSLNKQGLFAEMRSEEIQEVWNACQQASEEFQLSKQKLKEIIGTLYCIN